MPENIANATVACVEKQLQFNDVVQPALTVSLRKTTTVTDVLCNMAVSKSNI